ncbi:protein TIFY 4B-like isoform X2 [Hibiscus syriacus]|uniref:protein TIFY 4B-like isoform X2 n=1 Tax=Hibiscus syriacus TaxID=106335 RepID=UPI001920AB67|nr:protein TIFY 4B-like isoform X2 [Hibiscus syriacus]
MSTGETVCRSPLYKPISQLTEDDISQVTRDDCRCYLKEKGMRRPSWNKSQALQQVISLKTLLETTSDSEAAEASKKLYIPFPENPPRSNQLNQIRSSQFVSDSTVLPDETTHRSGISVPVSIPRIRPDPSKFKFSGENSVRTAVSGNDSVSPRSVSIAKEPAGQMTIFYCGEVNVYDNIPGFKAEAILQFAASQVLFPQETLVDQRTTPFSFPCHLQAAVKVAENCQFPQEDSNVSCDDSLEGPINRNALVQRYLEKKKDRFKNKRKLATSSSRSLDVYSNQMGDKFSNEHVKESESHSSTRARPPHVSLVKLHGKSSQDCQSQYSS